MNHIKRGKKAKDSVVITAIPTTHWRIMRETDTAKGFKTKKTAVTFEFTLQE